LKILKKLAHLQWFSLLSQLSTSPNKDQFICASLANACFWQERV